MTRTYLYRAKSPDGHLATSGAMSSLPARLFLPERAEDYPRSAAADRGAFIASGNPAGKNNNMENGK